MGDRGNIVIVQHAGLDGGTTGEIYLYAHWGGSVIARVVQCALLRAPDRWDDEPYLGRIIFSELTAGSERDNLSFGLSTYLTDNEHDLVVVDTAKQTVSIRPPDKPPTATFTFAEFAKKDLEAAHLVDEPMQCPTGAPVAIVPNGPIAGVEARPNDAAPPAAVAASHVPYVVVGIVVGAVVSALVVGSVRSR
jgi:hypothetical protein